MRRSQGGAKDSPTDSFRSFDAAAHNSLILLESGAEALVLNVSPQ
jgi:hypothetical protein